jgi:hypothetical protein
VAIQASGQASTGGSAAHTSSEAVNAVSSVESLTR